MEAVMNWCSRAVRTRFAFLWVVCLGLLCVTGVALVGYVFLAVMLPASATPVVFLGKVISGSLMFFLIAAFVSALIMYA